MENLGQEKISTLLKQFAVPATISYLVSAMYNIVDQIFIGQGVGYLGNAATNVAFPLTTVCMAISLLLGSGCASKLNIEMGKGNRDKIKTLVGTTFGSLIICGIVLTFVVQIFLNPLLVAFGATEQSLEYAVCYVRITSLSMTFLLISTAGNSIVRADGSATYSMAAMLSGAVINIILDPVFIFVFHWGIAGAAWATFISQVISGGMMLFYLPRFKSVKLKWRDFIPDIKIMPVIAKLGVSSLTFQLSSLAVQLTTNNLLKSYGAASVYGSDIPIAAAGIVLKINAVYSAFLLGITQGAQPVLGFNYGAKKYGRVRETYKYVIVLCSIVSVTAFIGFEFFPGQIMLLFGKGNELYMEYAVKYLRVFLFCVFLNGSQVATTLFFPAIGKAGKGALLSLSRQVIFLLPLLVIMAMITGVDKIMYAGPIADLLAWVLAMFFVAGELKNMPKTNELEEI